MFLAIILVLTTFNFEYLLNLNRGFSVLYNLTDLSYFNADFSILKRFYDFILGFFILIENVEIPPHKDMGHKACINIVLTDDPAPIKYKDYGEATYKNAILNVMKRHSVNAGPERKMIKFQLSNIYYQEAVDIWNKNHINRQIGESI